MEFVLSLLHTIIFLFLSILHLYWAISNDPGVFEMIPTDAGGRTIWKPRPIWLFLGAFMFYAFAMVNMFNEEFINLVISKKVINVAMAVIALAFFVRFVGDFRYVGISKTLRTSPFARRDSRIYVPFCLVMSLSHFLLILL
ncbi:hypothetical protein DBR32_14880 [Taibaiella sp. KBW10]|uniref:DUF3995 domain-containing protein n=1 Tax=Taibaiella sp. KBW10 TaxID=2153357 RepID=UPI000F59B4E0|nr:DUF3995 domain-containing protein [Taibaiella sp. KBW10]RQO29861.1 hypothetical protein DBR32_14880 [Taibaiella sp. KBW10]